MKNLKRIGLFLLNPDAEEPSLGARSVLLTAVFICFGLSVYHSKYNESIIVWLCLVAGIVAGIGMIRDALKLS